MTETPLEISLVDLPRQLGHMRHHDLTWIAPADLGTPSMSVPEGEPLDISVDLTSVDDGVLVRAHTRVQLHGECVRCLDPVVCDHDIQADDVFFEADRVAAMSAEDDEDSEDLRVIGARDTIDLEPLMRDAIVTLVDDRPLCRPDCAGLCPGCGEKWDDLPEDHEHVLVDPRMAGLAALLDTMTADETSEEQTS